MLMGYANLLSNLNQFDLAVRIYLKVIEQNP
jgi:hypothetical protein